MNIILIKNRAIGDTIMGLAALQYLRSMIPEAKLTYAIPKWIAPIFDKTQHSFDQIIPLDFHNMGAIFETTQKIINAKGNLFLEVHQAGRTSKLFSTLSTVTGTPYYFNNHQLTERAPSTQRDLDGVWKNLYPNHSRPHYLDFIPKLKTKSSSNDFVLLGLVASRWTKIWPIEFYLELIKSMPKTDFVIPLSNSAMDIKIRHDLGDLPRNATIAQVPISELPDLCAKSKIYLGNDTGLKHLCVALGKKTFTFFGPEEPFEWHPYDSNIHPYFFRENLECRTRTAHFCGLSHCDSMICLNQIRPEFVHERIKQYVS